MNLIEQSCGRDKDSTKAKMEIPLLPLGRMFEEFMTGICQDTNMAEMVNNFNKSKEDTVPGEDYWAQIGSVPEEKLHEWFQRHKACEDQLAKPTFGSYKTSFGDSSV